MGRIQPGRQIRRVRELGRDVPDLGPREREPRARIPVRRGVELDGGLLARLALLGGDVGPGAFVDVGCGARDGSVWGAGCDAEVVPDAGLESRWERARCRREGLGRVVVFDLKRQSVVQERVLNVEESPELLRQMGGSFLEVTKVQYLDRGRKMALKACGSDDGLEVYDFVANRKWRFAPERGLDRGWAFGGDLVVLQRKGMIASVDSDAVTFWKVPFGEGE